MNKTGLAADWIIRCRKQQGDQRPQNRIAWGRRPSRKWSWVRSGTKRRRRGLQKRNKTSAANYGVAAELQEKEDKGKAGQTRGCPACRPGGHLGDFSGTDRSEEAYGAVQAEQGARGLDHRISTKGPGSLQRWEGRWGPAVAQYHLCKMPGQRRRQRKEARDDGYVGQGSTKGRRAIKQRMRRTGHM